MTPSRLREAQEWAASRFHDLTLPGSSLIGVRLRLAGRQSRREAQLLEEVGQLYEKRA
jgi:hypothetical protein